MLSGILQPTSGEIIVNGVSPQKDRKRVVQNLGVVFGQRSQLNWDLRLAEHNPQILHHPLPVLLGRNAAH